MVKTGKRDSLTISVGDLVQLVKQRCGFERIGRAAAVDEISGVVALGQSLEGDVIPVHRHDDRVVVVVAVVHAAHEGRDDFGAGRFAAAGDAHESDEERPTGIAQPLHPVQYLGHGGFPRHDEVGRDLAGGGIHVQTGGNGRLSLFQLGHLGLVFLHGLYDLSRQLLLRNVEIVLLRHGLGLNDHLNVVVVHVHGRQLGALLFAALLQEFGHLLGLLLEQREGVVDVQFLDLLESVPHVVDDYDFRGRSIEQRPEVSRRRCFSPGFAGRRNIVPSIIGGHRARRECRSGGSEGGGDCGRLEKK
mmetsp:Transcript_33509/g.61875  ORF Transcript_33509/g.61875 Transcript_33509/m.61875 type:complete len:303 (-) Transcript_33509:152-1060(-)